VVFSIQSNQLNRLHMNDLLPDFYRKERVEQNLISCRNELIINHKKCGGSGFITRKNKLKIDSKTTLIDLEDNYNKNRIKCSCYKKYSTLSEFIISGIKKEFWDCENWGLLDKPKKNKDCWKYIRVYIKNIYIARNKGIGFIHRGPNGTGKTSAGMLTLINALRSGYRVHYMYMRELMNDFRVLTISDKSYDLEALRGYVDEVCDCDFVFIDEVGKAKHSEFSRDEFEGFLRKRMSNGLPTIMATNLSREQVTKVYGESFHDLLWGSVKELSWIGPSYRKKNKQKDIEEFFTENWNVKKNKKASKKYR